MSRKSKVQVKSAHVAQATNEELIRDTIERHQLWDSEDNEQILELLLHQQQNIDAITDNVSRLHLCKKRSWSEPSESDRVSFCLEASRSGESKRDREWRSCVSDNRKKLVDRSKFHRLRRTRLMEQIRKCRGQVIRLRMKAEREQEFVEEQGEAGATHWSEIETRPLPRISTGLLSLDRIFGVTLAHICPDTGRNIPEKSGPVIGKVYAFAAEQGMGKSRLATRLMKMMCGKRSKIDLPSGKGKQWYGGMKGVYFQAESTKSDFASTFVRDVWVLGETDVLIAGDTLLAKHHAIIEEVEPDIIVIDSKDMLYEFKTSSLVENAIKMYRRWAVEHGFVLFIISHVNKAGELKGNTKFGHAVDGVLIGQRSQHDPDLFSLAFTKNRMGRIKQEVWFHHTNTSVEEWDMTEIQTEMEPGLALLLADVEPDGEVAVTGVSS